MIGLTEALTSFDVAREQVRILSIGCGDDPYRVSGAKIFKGGMLHWRDIMFAAMRLQSQSALGQVGLMVGPENLLRIDVPKAVPQIALDDWRSAVEFLPAAAQEAVESQGNRAFEMFLRQPASIYRPVYDLD